MEQAAEDCDCKPTPLGIALGVAIDKVSQKMLHSFDLQLGSLEAKCRRRHQDGENVVWSLCDRLGTPQRVEKSSSWPNSSGREAQELYGSLAMEQRHQGEHGNVAHPERGCVHWCFFGALEMAQERSTWETPWRR